ncbi:DUF397 domain-containing protein [Streptomyces sp. NPDC090306]|uniref:DUF397 domain-containing protein n=1 Tax=Streptomyces sp. NPDC090306 TaxID=3365961 RepID=UPI00380497D0
MTQPRWTKSSHSNNGGQCVEVATNLAAHHGVVPLRDSKRTDGPVLAPTAAAFTSFVKAVKAAGFGTEGTIL